MHDTLFRAIELSKKFGIKVFFDLNLALPLWASRDKIKEVINTAWKEADIIEVSRDEPMNTRETPHLTSQEKLAIVLPLQLMIIVHNKMNKVKF
jgi:sugar/nucleoside kinase (ribokinase family)